MVYVRWLADGQMSSLYVDYCYFQLGYRVTVAMVLCPDGIWTSEY